MSSLIEIAAHWGEVTEAPLLVAARENRVYECKIGSQRAALRVHRAGYQSRIAIESELRWTARLADFGFPCARPLVSDDGGYLRSLPGGQYASAVAWLDGHAIGAGDVPLEGSDAEITLLYTAVGALLASLHTATDMVETNDVLRPAWDADALLGDAPLWGRFWENPSLTQSETDLLLRTKAKAYDHLVTMDRVDAGLIHADCLQENILTTPAGLALIDFDDAGFGYRAYDLGTAIIQHWEHPKRALIETALLNGYGTLRSAPDAEQLRFFTLLRALASCGWVISRGAGDDMYLRAMADRAVALALEWVG